MRILRYQDPHRVIDFAALPVNGPPLAMAGDIICVSPLQLCWKQLDLRT